MTHAIQKAIDRAYEELIYKIVLNAFQDEAQRQKVAVNISRMDAIKSDIEKTLK